jgi:hypothetical protein
MWHDLLSVSLNKQQIWLHSYFVICTGYMGIIIKYEELDLEVVSDLPDFIFPD